MEFNISLQNEVEETDKVYGKVLVQRPKLKHRTQLYSTTGNNYFIYYTVYFGPW